MEDEKIKGYRLPPNYKVQGKWKRFYIRNLVEAAIAVAIVEYFIIRIPFIWQVKTFLAILIGVSVAALFVSGIYGRSVTQFIFAYLKFVYTKRNYSFKDIRKVKEEDYNNGKANPNREKAETETVNTRGSSRLEIAKARFKKATNRTGKK